MHLCLAKPSHLIAWEALAVAAGLLCTELSSEQSGHFREGSLLAPKETGSPTPLSDSVQNKLVVAFCLTRGSELTYRLLGSTFYLTAERESVPEQMGRCFGRETASPACTPTPLLFG